MITDTTIEAIDTMIEMCGSERQARGMCSVREMLCDLDEEQFSAMSQTEREEWLEQFLGCARKRGTK